MGFSVRWCVELELSIVYYGHGWRNGVRLCGDATTRGIASCFGASMTPCRRSGVQSPGRRFSLTDRWLPPELICAWKAKRGQVSFNKENREQEAKGDIVLIDKSRMSPFAILAGTTRKLGG